MSRAKEFRRLQSEVLEKEGFGKAEIQAIYLGVIADSLAAIADCLERLSDKDGEKIRQCSEALSSGTDPDTISRQAAIDGKICIRRSNGVEIYDDYVVPVEYLEQLPSAQPEPSQVAKDIARIVENGQDMRVIAQPERIKGRWIEGESQCGIKCSKCGYPVDDFCHSIDYIDLDYAPNFCPNCGSDNREVTT